MPRNPKIKCGLQFLLRAVPVLLVLFALGACRVDRKLDNKHARERVRMKCKGTAYHVTPICDDDRKMLEWAAKYPKYPRLKDLNTDVLLKIQREQKDMDLASAVLYHRIISEPRNAAFLKYLARRQDELAKKLPDYKSLNVLFAVAPGMFYKDNPNVGADGKMLRDLAVKLGMKQDVIPSEQTGTVTENGRIICEYIRKRNDVNSIILASTSKGSSDIKMALKICGKESAFKKVVAWFSMAGMFKGSYLMRDINNNWRYRVEGRTYFCWKGYNWDGFLSLRGGRGMLLDEPLVVPSRILLVNIIPIPTFRLVTPRAKPFYMHLLRYGPNDGMSVLGEYLVENAITFGSWRNDHYFRFPMYQFRMMAFMTYIVENQIMKKSASR